MFTFPHYIKGPHIIFVINKSKFGKITLITNCKKEKKTSTVVETFACEVTGRDGKAEYRYIGQR